LVLERMDLQEGDILANKKTLLLISAMALSSSEKKSELISWLNKSSFKGQDKIDAYQGVVHSFTSKDADAIKEKFPQMPVAYNAEADSASWEQMKKLFESSFK